MPKGDDLESRSKSISKSPKKNQQMKDYGCSKKTFQYLHASSAPAASFYNDTLKCVLRMKNTRQQPFDDRVCNFESS